MIRATLGYNLLKVVLNCMDAINVLFFIVGGLNAISHSTSIGYGTVAFGIGILYLSTGMWIGGRWKLITRFTAYLILSCTLFVVLVNSVVQRHESMAAQAPLPTVFALLVANDILSALQLRNSAPSVVAG